MAANRTRVPDDSAGFFAEVTASEVRRQLRMSVGIVVVLALGIVSAAVTVGAHPLEARRAVVSASPVIMLHAETNAIGAKAI